MKSLLAAMSLCLVVVTFGGCATPPTFQQTKKDGGTKTNNGGLDLAGATQCGGAAEECCHSELCAVGLTCSAKGVCCGAGGYSCQVGTECCAGYACSGGRCCAGISSSCTVAADCCDGLACVDGTCDKASMGGGAGDSCSANGDCASGFECLAGTCSACGTTNAACCTTTTACGPGSTCTANRCQSTCGAPGGACCATGTACQTGLSCTDSKCVSSSTTGPGALCTPTTDCGHGYMCISGVCQALQVCNTAGSMCCSGGTCQGSTLQCSENGTCQTKPSCTAIQGTCTQTAACCTGYQCQNTQQDDGTAHNECCVSAGTSCPNGDLDCCGWLTCQGGKCTKQLDGHYCLQNSDCVNNDCDQTSGLCGGAQSQCGTQKPIGAACTTDTMCCDGICATLASTGSQVCCETQSNTCSSSSDCCGKMLCQSGTCTPRQTGQSCIGRGECANDVPCTNGKCGASGAVAAGGPCTSTSQCQSGLTCDTITGYCVQPHPTYPCMNINECPYNMDCEAVSGFSDKICCIFSSLSCTDAVTGDSNGAYCCSQVCGSDGNCQ